MLEDFATQWRNGVFPVWIGQSVYAYNGAVSPVRVAPLFQHLGGMLDLVTFHSLQPTALKNALIALLGVGTSFASYFSFRTLLPRKPWVAVVVSFLWVASPAILYMPMAHDLYLSLTSMLFVPVVFASLWTLWVKDGYMPRIILSAALAGAWLAHPPVASWLTLIAAGVWFVKLLTKAERMEEPGRFAISAVSFLALGSFPFFSTASLGTTDRSFHVSTSAVSNSVSSVSAMMSLLSSQDQHPGYPILILFCIGSALILKARPKGAWIFLSVALSIGLLTIRVPGITLSLWKIFPNAFLTVQGDWPNQRLMPIWSFALLGVFAIGAGSLVFKKTWHSVLFYAVVLSPCVYFSTLQAKNPLRITYERVGSAQASNKMTDPSNLVIGRSSYSFFAKPPNRLSLGYSDPLLENRILDQTSYETVVSNFDAAAPGSNGQLIDTASTRHLQSGELIATSDNHSQFYKLTPVLKLPAGTRTALRIKFTKPDLGPFFQLESPALFREYVLPDSGAGLAYEGSPHAFGSLPTSGSVISLGVSPSEQTPTITLIEPAHFDLPPFGAAKFWLYRYSPSDLPVNVYSMMPYKADVNSPVNGWVETPHMWLSGYEARVNKKPTAVRKSPQGLVMIPIPLGHSNIRLDYVAPLWLTTIYLLTIASWTILVASLLTLLLRSPSKADRA